MMKKTISILLVFSMLYPFSVFADSEIPYKYDANGNLVSGDGKYFEYNDANKLVRVRQSDVNCPGIWLNLQQFYDLDKAGQEIGSDLENIIPRKAA